MRNKLLIALLGVFAISCAAEEGYSPIGDDCSTCDDKADDWFVPACASAVKAMTPDQKARAIGGEVIMLGEAFCEAGETSRAILQCVAGPSAESPTGLVVVADVNDCDDGEGACRVDEASGPVCEACAPGEETCMSENSGPWGVFRCGDDFNWERILDCGDAVCGKDEQDMWTCATN